MKGEAARLGARRNEAGWRGLAGAASDGALHGLACLELEQERGANGKGYKRRGERRSFEARRRSPRQPTRGVASASPVAVWAPGVTVPNTIEK